MPILFPVKFWSKKSNPLQHNRYRQLGICCEKFHLALPAIHLTDLISIVKFLTEDCTSGDLATAYPSPTILICHGLGQ